MPPILNAQGLSKRFGATPLFTDISFTIDDGDRIGLIGPNGAGKSTLLRILAGEEEPDSGELALRKRARIAYVHQESVFAPGLTIRDVLERALDRAGIPAADREGPLRETSGRIGFSDRVEVGTVALTAHASTLSGGWRKRLAIAEAIVSHPDILLLDEPTNHLDLEGIAWLEDMLNQAQCASVMISHDRYFLENTATSIVELNRVYAGGLLRVRGAYSKFLEGKEAYLLAQASHQASLENRVRNEIEWLRRGPKARATKAKARIDNAHELIGQLRDINTRMKTSATTIDFTATGRETHRLIKLDKVSIEVGGRTILRDLNLMLNSGMKIGLVGPNGSGKTTLLRVLTGQLSPAAGSVKRAPALNLVYFSQTRELDESLTLRRALAPDSDSVVYQGKVIHVASYAAKFLFTQEQLNQPVERLSGGERARILIARLMLQPCDVLLLDEPTNDLDIATLEILEESLLEFTGALVLVTHDRYLLDRVSNVVLGLDGQGNSERFADYGQWEQWRREQTQQAQPGSAAQSSTKSSSAAAPLSTAANDAASNAASSTAKPASKKKLSYLEAREFAGIEDAVEAAEVRLQAAREALEDPAVATNATALTAALAEQEAAQHEADKLYARWAELTEKAG